MGLFNQRKPRRFDHRYMFVDERKDKLRDVERRAKAELGMGAPDRPERERLRGVFLNATRHASSLRRERRLAGGFVLTYGVILVLLVILIAVWKMLLSL